MSIRTVRWAFAAALITVFGVACWLSTQPYNDTIKAFGRTWPTPAYELVILSVAGLVFVLVEAYSEQLKPIDDAVRLILRILTNILVFVGLFAGTVLFAFTAMMASIGVAAGGWNWSNRLPFHENFSPPAWAFVLGCGMMSALLFALFFYLVERPARPKKN